MNFQAIVLISIFFRIGVYIYLAYESYKVRNWSVIGLLSIYTSVASLLIAQQIQWAAISANLAIPLLYIVVMQNNRKHKK